MNKKKPTNKSFTEALKQLNLFAKILLALLFITAVWLTYSEITTQIRYNNLKTAVDQIKAPAGGVFIAKESGGHGQHIFDSYCLDGICPFYKKVWDINMLIQDEKTYPERYLQERGFTIETKNIGNCNAERNVCLVEGLNGNYGVLAKLYRSTDNRDTPRGTVSRILVLSGFLTK